MLPITLRPNGRRAVIVGGGGVAARKAQTLCAAGFPIAVVAAAIGPEMRALLERHAGESAERPYQASDLTGAGLVVAATDSDEVNARVVDDARAASVLVCDARDPARGDFAFPATARTGDLTIAVDSGGAAPAFSKRVAGELAAFLGPQYGAAVKTLANMRAYAKIVLAPERRAAALKALAALPIADLAAMNPAQAEHEVDAAVAGTPARAERATAHFTCASRASALATIQARAVAARLARRGIATTILAVTTTGDRDRSRPIEALGSINVFVTELETALRDGRADYAVHSCKDLPSELAADMQIAAVSAREDPRDAFCSERYPNFNALPPGATVGTSSPRRRLQLAAQRPDLVFEDLRGNVDTRLRKLRDGRYDAIVLAMAGLNRLSARAAYTVPFGIDDLVPAVGQGALAIETRAADEPVARELRAAINDSTVERCVACERAGLRALRAGCSAPIGIHAVVYGDVTVVTGARALADGTVLRARIERRIEGLAEAEILGVEMAARLTPRSRLVVLARTRERPSRIAAALRADGVEVIELHAGDDGPDPAERTPDMLLFPSSAAVSAAQAYLARLRDLERRPLVAVMGAQSREAAGAAGFEPDAVSDDPSVDAFVRLVRERLTACP
ncbi:MAG TPA: hydroxymethylbilane synthase [Candidatus Tumulicola sp.]|jgi:hydroxymethylbilane synthase